MPSLRYTPALAAVLALVACGEIKSEDQEAASADANMVDQQASEPVEGAEAPPPAEESAEAGTGTAVDEPADAAAAPDAEAEPPSSEEAPAEDATPPGDEEPSEVVREGDTRSRTDRRDESAADEPCEVGPDGEVVTEGDPNAEAPCEVAPEDEAPSEEEVPPESDPTDATLEPPIDEPT